MSPYSNILEFGARRFCGRAGGHAVRIKIDDLRDERVQALLAFHLREMHASSPPGAVFALDHAGLTAPGITVWTGWNDNALLGVGALKMIDGSLAEIKSMRTHPDHLRTGVAAELLHHIIAEARRRGVRRLALETGSGAAFEPALSLYRKAGFVNGPAFGDYLQSDFNQFLHLSLGLDRDR
jgi:putative acetyltransferase